jgi:hypothetical protein
MKSICRVGVAAGLAAACGVASATPCDSALSSYEDAVLGFAPASQASTLLSAHPECFPAGSVTSRVQINSTSFVQVSAISTALASRWFADGPVPRADAGVRGMAAGGVGKAWNVWGNLNQNDTRQSYTAANAFNSKYDSNIRNTVIGADYALSPTMAVGVSAAYDRGDGSGLNANPGNTPNTFNSDGSMIAPYFGMQISKELAFDASIGLGRGKLRTDSSTEAKADRWFGGANLAYNRWMGNLQWTGKASYLHGEEKYDNSRDTATGATFVGTGAKNKIDQLQAGVQAGYWMNGFMPYAGLKYSSDVHRSTSQFGAGNDPIGKGAWVWALGVNFFSMSNGVTGGIAYNQEESRSNQKNNSLTANISLRF